MSSNKVCSERDAPFTSFPDVFLDAPLGMVASVSVRFRFECACGESASIQGSVGGDGGVRVPLAVVMVMAMARVPFAMRERCRRDVQRAHCARGVLGWLPFSEPPCCAERIPRRAK
jgi:hypothetical protein